MEKTEIKAVEMTRRIRERHAEQLRGATPEERIRFYREKATRLNEEIATLLARAEDSGSRHA
jgi:hypothetical protein